MNGLEKYNQETAALQTQLDKLKAARATDLATYQRDCCGCKKRNGEGMLLMKLFVF